LYGPWLGKNADDARNLAVARWATLGGLAAAVGIAFAVMHFENVVGALALGFAFLNAPLFATFLLGMFWRRATGHAAFAGVVTGMVAAIAHFGLTLSAGALPGTNGGMHGGWIAVLHVYPSAIAQAAWTALFGFAVNLIVIWVASFCSAPRSTEELAGLVHSLLPDGQRRQ